MSDFLQSPCVSRREEKEPRIRRLSKRLIKGKVPQMSQRSRLCPSPLARQEGPATCKCCAHGGCSPLLRTAPGCSMQRSTTPESSSAALRFSPLCSQTDSLLQTDHFGFLNVTGLAKQQRRVHSWLDIKIDIGRWVRAGRRGNSLIPFLRVLEMPQRREVREISPSQEER